MIQRSEENEVTTCLEMKMNLLNRYLSLTEGIKESFDKKEPKDLLRILSKREDFIARIQRIDRAIDKIMRRGAGKSKEALLKRTAMIDDYLENMKDVMKKTDIVDKELLGFVKEAAEEVKRELLRNQEVLRAATGYKRCGKSSPRFLDTVR